MKVAVAVAVVAVALPVRAHAQAPSDVAPRPDPLMPPPPAEPGVESYRGTMLAIDGAALGLVVVGMWISPSVSAFGALAFAAGPPVLHLTKLRGGTALGSFSMRIAFPLLGVVIGDAIPRDCGPSPCMTSPPPAILWGLAGGAVVAASLDSIFLAKGDRAWTPVATPAHGGATVGIAGSF